MYTTDPLINERETIIRLIAGDEDAFCELYAAYKNRLLYFAMKFVKSRDFAEDIFQDAFTIIWQGRRFINPDASFSSYLYTIVKNRILNQIRDMDKEDTLKEQVLAQAIDYTDNTKDNILANDLKAVVTRAFESLTPRQREIFSMSREGQLSHKEIAEALGISINTVQEHISVSLRTIRAYLAKYSDTYADMLLILICLNL
ncbi:RNA polymerase sigma-70 factor [Phocaeicola sp.]